MQDSELVARIGRGDRAAMKLLYERHQAGLFAFVRARLGDAFEAADVMQEAFLEVWRVAAGFRGQASVKTWLYGIARNKAVDRMRRAQRMTLRESPDETLPDESPEPSAVIEAARDAEKLRDCLGKLPPVQLSAVRLTFFEEMTCAEAAAIEGVPVGTVKTRIHHAKKLLMHCLGRGAGLAATA